MIRVYVCCVPHSGTRSIIDRRTAREALMEMTYQNANETVTVHMVALHSFRALMRLP